MNLLNISSGFHTMDFVIFGAYLVLLIALGVFFSRNKKGKEKDSKDYFLAGNSLTWWAVGASLIAANISAEQFIGMSGSGYKIGLCVAAYELMAAAALILVAKYLLPVMIKRNIFTIPQFLRQRYNNGVGLAFSIFWLFLYIFVNLTSVAWLGALAIEQILGLQGLSITFAEFTISIEQIGLFITYPGFTISVRMLIILALFCIAGLYSIYGGLSAVAWTDVLQVVFLVGGGLITAYFALDAVSGTNGNALDGLSIVYNKLKTLPSDTHFDLIVNRADSVDAYKDLPGICAILGAVWISNIAYWGFNQYIIQKGLAAKNLEEAKKGLLFAGMLKILIPIIVVLPGICAFVMANYPEAIPGLQEGYYTTHGTINVADDAYPWLVRNFAPVGIKGLSFAALTAAIISSLASMFNSTSTIFTMDIYKQYINKSSSERGLVKVGRITSLVALVIALIAVKPLLGGLDQAFQYIQEYSGFVYPGICVVFGLGLLWKRASGKAAVWTAIATLPLGIIFKIAFPEMPFLFRMGYVFMCLILIFVSLTYCDKSATISSEKNTTFIKGKDAKKMLLSSAVIGTLAIICLVLAIIQKVLYVKGGSSIILYLDDIGFETLFFTAAFLSTIALVLYSNATDAKQDSKAVEIDLSLFKTSRSFNIGAIAIVLILVILYTVFW